MKATMRVIYIHTLVHRRIIETIYEHKSDRTRGKLQQEKNTLMLFVCVVYSSPPTFYVGHYSRRVGLRAVVRIKLNAVIPK